MQDPCIGKHMPRSSEFPKLATESPILGPNLTLLTVYHPRPESFFSEDTTNPRRRHSMSDRA
jgi:hypothetical protein